MILPVTLRRQSRARAARRSLIGPAPLAAAPHLALRCSIAAPMRQPNAAVDVNVRTRFQADHLASLKCWRTAARSPMRAGSPAALIVSLSGTLTAMVMITAIRYRTNAAPSHGSRLRLRSEEHTSELQSRE